MAGTPAESASTSVRFVTRLATLLLAVVAAIGLFVVGHAIYGAAAGGREVSFRGLVDVHARTGRVPAGVRLGQLDSAEVPVHILHASAKQQFLSLGRDIWPFILLIVGLWLVRGVVRSIRDGDPFNESNVRRLRIIAVLLMLVPVVEFIRQLFDNALASTVPGLTNWPNGVGLSLNGPLAGVVVLVLAQVFAHGVRLREDVEGTI